MRIEPIILASLLPFLVAGTCCFPPPKQEPFVLDTALTEEQVARAIEGWPEATRATVPCEALCRQLHDFNGGHRPLTVDECTHTMAPEPAATPEAEVGRVQCRGMTYSYACKGRRPLGHVEEECAGEEEDAGAYFGRCAQLEAASVVAFEELAEWLAEIGAPAGLVGRCVTAAEDERRHAAAMGAFARRRGGAVSSPRQEACARSLRAVALHNAVEGCVHEAWGAVEATWQARHAEDAEVRAALARIAVEEAAHAQLAWDLHAWLMGQVDEGERAEVGRAQAAAIARLPAMAAGQVCPAELGMPDARTIEAIARRFADGLAAAA